LRFEKRVLLTREPADIERDRIEFLKRNIGIVRLPLIKTVDVPFICPGVRPDYIVFQSKRAFEYFVKKSEIPRNTKIIAVGEKTKNFLEKRGYRVHRIPEEQRAEGICEVMKNEERGVVWIPRAEGGREEAVLCLRKMGFTVFAFFVYKTFNIYYKPSLFKCRVGSADAVIFASPSAVVGFFENLKNCRYDIDLGNKLFVAIGKTTNDCLKAYGIENALIPYKPNIGAIAESLNNLWHDS